MANRKEHTDGEKNLNTPQIASRNSYTHKYALSMNSRHKKLRYPYYDGGQTSNLQANLVILYTRRITDENCAHRVSEYRNNNLIYDRANPEISYKITP